MSNHALSSSVWTPRVLSVLRIASGLTLLEYGMGKHLGFPQLPQVPPVGSMSWVGGLFELIGGALLAVGFFTRPVAFLLSGEMAVAYFYRHFPRDFFPAINGGVPAILFCFIFLYLFFAGPGPWSVDQMHKPK